MAEVKVLIEGSAKEEGGFELAFSTVTLIKEGDFKIIVDPGKKLLELADYIIPGHGKMFKIEKQKSP